MAHRKWDLSITPLDIEYLRRILKARTLPSHHEKRARALILASEGKTNREIGKAVGLHYNNVARLLRKYRELGVDAVDDLPRSGRRTGIGFEKAERILDRATQQPPVRKRWSVRTMAREAGVSKATVQRLWSRNGIKPHLTRVFKISKDPNFEDKFWDIIALYLNPPERALVLCCDEKSQIQALQRRQPGLPLKQGEIQTKTHDYYRHGTVTLFAALNYLDGRIISMHDNRHTHQEWLKFLKKIHRETPRNLDVHLVLDNYSAHKHPVVRSWLAAHPRFHEHYTPTSGSWMNLVERFFRDISEDVIRPGSFSSVGELTACITQYLEQHNLTPKRYVWHADGQRILEKISRAKEALAASECH